MKMRIALILGFLSFVTMNLKAQETVIDFETGEKALWTKSKEFISITNEKAVSGTYSFKYSCNEIPAGVENFQGYVESNKIFSPDTYSISLKIWIDESFKGTNFNLNFSKPWSSTSWKINKVAKGQWVEMYQEVVVEKESSKFYVSVSANPKWGGTGTLYIDDIKIVKK